MLPPVVILVIGMATVVGAIVLLRLHAFLALIAGAIIVSLLSAGEPAVRIARTAEGFGRTAGSIGIVIGLASIIGKAMMDSGAAARIVNAFLRLLGEEHGAAALGATGFVLSIPVFFDTVFYLLVPLARSMHARTGRQYLKYLMAIAAGAAATHTLVPPTPGPLAVASLLGVDIGLMVMIGFVVAVPAAIAGMLFAGWTDKRMPIVPAARDDDPLHAGGATTGLPGLIASITPIALPVLLISANTLTAAMTVPGRAHSLVWERLAPTTIVLGNPNVALFLAAIFSLWLYRRQMRASLAAVEAMAEEALRSAGTIILITAAGGAFGATLQAAEIGPAIQSLFAGRGGVAGTAFLLLAFAVSCLIKVAQGSSTVAMITTAGMMAAMLKNAPALPFHAVYLATAIAGGSLVGTWMNDSGFWVFSRLGGVSELQTLKSWTPLSAIVGTTAMLTTVVLSLAYPLR